MRKVKLRDVIIVFIFAIGYPTWQFIESMKAGKACPECSGWIIFFLPIYFIIGGVIGFVITLVLGMISEPKGIVKSKK